MPVALPLDPDDFAQSEFGDCRLGDSRRTNRLVTIVADWTRDPSKSIHARSCGSYKMNATYEFFKQDYAHPDLTQAVHRQRTRQRCSLPGHYLLLEDTTDVTFPGRKPVKGLGPITDKSTQGFKAHSVLAVRVPDSGLRSPQSRHAPLSICGLMHQSLFLRPAREKKQERKDRRPGEVKPLETDCWENTARVVGPAPSDNQVRWTYVADRAADIIDHVASIVEHGAGFVIRSKHDRRLRQRETGRDAGKLWGLMRDAQSLGSFELHLRSRPGQSARTARLHVSSCTEVTVQSPPGVGRGRQSGPGFILNGVRIWEKGREGEDDFLEWLLLTNEPVKTFEQALQVGLIYSCRWLVEEFHKALKTGMGVEKLQLEEGSRLMAATAVMSIVALRIIDLREHSRLNGSAPVSEAGLDATDVRLLERLTERRITTTAEGVAAIARLGGFAGRRGDGEPGMLVIWRGFQQLLLIKTGYLMAAGPDG